MAPLSSSTQPPLPWRGIHHIALATHDLDETLHFYQTVLGMEVSDIAPSQAGRGRHAIVLVKPGDEDTLGFHFFERPTAVRPSGPATLATAGSSGQPMLHIALRLPDERAANDLRERLRIHEVAVTEIPELGSFVFSDTNAVLLEVTWPQG